LGGLFYFGQTFRVCKGKGRTPKRAKTAPFSVQFLPRAHPWFSKGLTGRKRKKPNGLPQTFWTRKTWKMHGSTWANVWILWAFLGPFFRYLAYHTNRSSFEEHIGHSKFNRKTKLNDRILLFVLTEV
jgi:hypothetical protein